MNKLTSEQLKNLIFGGLLLIIGILFCCSLSIGISGLSVVIGLLLLISGIIFTANAIIVNKNVMTINGIIGSLLISLGIVFVINKLAGIVFIFIPWFLIVIGAVLVLECILGYIVRKDMLLVEFIIKLIIAIIAIVLGICLLAIDGFAEYSSILLGIVMIIYSIVLIYKTFTNKSIKED